MFQDVNYHSGQKHACVLFLYDTDHFVTAGFNKVGFTLLGNHGCIILSILLEMREAELVLWNARSLSKPVCRQSLGPSSSG